MSCWRRLRVVRSLAVAHARSPGARFDGKVTIARHDADQADEEDAAETDAEEDDDFDPEDSDCGAVRGAAAPARRRSRPTRAARPRQCLADSDDEEEEEEEDVEEAAEGRRGGRMVLDDSEDGPQHEPVTPKPVTVRILAPMCFLAAVLVFLAPLCSLPAALVFLAPMCLLAAVLVFGSVGCCCGIAVRISAV